MSHLPFKDIRIGDKDSYQRLFQSEGMPYLISDIFSEHYRTWECLLTFVDHTWTAFLPKKVVTETLQEGYELYSDPDRFNEYKKGFQGYQETSSEFFEQVINQDTLSQEQVLAFFQFATGLFFFYSKTEFFYTDKAFEESSNNSLLKASLEELGVIKNDGRAYLNKIFFGETSHLSRFLNILGQMFDVPSSELRQYSREEIFFLFEDKKQSSETIHARLMSYIMISDGKSFRAVEGESAKQSAKPFLYSLEREKAIFVKGRCANKGRVQGRVKVIAMSYNKYDRLNEIISSMGKGHILVAETTSPEFIVACHKAGAIVTNQGGMMSHAAIVSRELNIPCVVGTQNATDVFKDGDLVEVDADQGLVRRV